MKKMRTPLQLPSILIQPFHICIIMSFLTCSIGKAQENGMMKNSFSEMHEDSREDSNFLKFTFLNDFKEVVLGIEDIEMTIGHQGFSSYKANIYPPIELHGSNESSIGIQSEKRESKNMLRMGVGILNNQLSNRGEGLGSFNFDYQRFLGQNNFLSIELGLGKCSSMDKAQVDVPADITTTGWARSEYSAFVMRLGINAFWYYGPVMSLHSGIGVSHISGTQKLEVRNVDLSLVFIPIYYTESTHYYDFSGTYIEFDLLGFDWSIGDHFGFSLEIGKSFFGNLRIGSFVKF